MKIPFTRRNIFCHVTISLHNMSKLLAQLLCLTVLLTLSAMFQRSEAGSDRIVVDQVGYRPQDPKIAILRGAETGDFEVVNTATGKSVYSNAIPTNGKQDQATGDEIYILDFTPLKDAGTYQVRIKGSADVSQPFSISRDAYSGVLETALEGFYYQRCGTDVNNGAIWRHTACHLDDAALYGHPEITVSCAGGWHDAGDYGKYVPTGAVSAAFLLYLYEDKPASFIDRQLKIPEAGNAVPDILDEARWELSWLLKMQDSSGGVHHKISSLQWTGEHLPDHDPDKRYLFEISSTATAASAAVLALGARMFEKFDKPFSVALLRSSVLCWKYLSIHPGIVPDGGFHNPADVVGGEYGDADDHDERLWASVELYRTTGNELYHRYFLAHYEEELAKMAPVSWVQVQDFALVSYTQIASSSSDKKVRAEIVAKLTDKCDDLVRQVSVNGYRTALGIDEYYWGSNSVDAAYGFDLIAAYNVTRSDRFLNAALDQLHYLLGRNTFGLSFVTGVGSHRVDHPYHQFSMLLHDGNPVPGLLAGGPNSSSKLHGTIISPFPGGCYEDNEKNYFVNEVAINYSAPFVFLCGYFSNPIQKGTL
jgi:endoglucanase